MYKCIGVTEIRDSLYDIVESVANIIDGNINTQCSSNNVEQQFQDIGIRYNASEDIVSIQQLNSS